MIDQAIKNRIKAEYRLTDKQAAAITAYIHGGARTLTEATEQAGYRSSMQPTAMKQSKAVRAAMDEEAKRVERLGKSVKEFKARLEEDPRKAIKDKLVAHAEDERVTPNQTRAVEILAKIEGLMVERVEIDPGEFFRSSMGRELFPEHITRLIEQKPQE